MVSLKSKIVLCFSYQFAGTNKAEVATHILQFTFNGCEGFHFPVAYWPTSQINASSLFNIYWEVVFALHQHGFYVNMCVCDGAQANRSFILHHFKDEEAAILANFTTINLVTGQNHIFMMDPSVSTIIRLI